MSSATLARVAGVARVCGFASGLIESRILSEMKTPPCLSSYLSRQPPAPPLTAMSRALTPMNAPDHADDVFSSEYEPSKTAPVPKSETPLDAKENLPPKHAGEEASLSAP